MLLFREALNMLLLIRTLFISYIQPLNHLGVFKGSLDRGLLSNESSNCPQLLDSSVFDVDRPRSLSSEAAMLRPDRHFNSQELNALWKQMIIDLIKYKLSS